MLRRRILPAIAIVIIMTGTLYLLERLLIPKHVTAIVEGSLIEAYYEEDAEHDVLFIGDCEVYESFSPVTLWEHYGITSYIRGSAQQLIWQSYYLLEETLKYETPEVVVFNVLAMKFDEPQKEAYNRMALDGMRMSLSKLKSIRASMMEDEKFVEYLFPLLRYHSRWSELTAEDFRYMFRKDRLFHNGYYMRVDVRPVESIPKGRKLANYQFGETAYYYLNRMVELCKEKGIELVLIKVPSLYPYWYDQWDEQMADYAKEHGLLYINFLKLVDEVGINFAEDTYDRGLHLNVTGAEKMSLYFGEILQRTYNLKDRRYDQELYDIWRKKVDFYYKMKEDQYRELEEYGYLKSYGARPPEQTE